MQGEVIESPSSSDSSLLFSLLRYGNDYITWDGECSVGESMLCGLSFRETIRQSDSGTMERSRTEKPLGDNNLF